jgi:hypothetical protein
MLRYTYTLFFTEHTSFLLNFMLAHFRDDAWNLYQWEFVEHYQFLSEAEKNKLVINWAICFKWDFVKWYARIYQLIE